MKKIDEFLNMDSPLWAVIMRWVYAFVAVVAWVSIFFWSMDRPSVCHTIHHPGIEQR